MILRLFASFLLALALLATQTNCNGESGDDDDSPGADADGDGYANEDADGNTVDCDDHNPNTYPGAVEVVNDGIDQDCDGIDAVDADHDGFIAASTDGGIIDCNDHDATIYPNAPEVCDEKDQDCDGYVDDGVQVVIYQDQDGDQWGNELMRLWGCSWKDGYTDMALDFDCDDTRYDIYPGAPELCNERDDNCNYIIDEGYQTTTWYSDYDGDGFGGGAYRQACTQPPGFTNVPGDCYDGDPLIYPGAPERCNNLDDDCDIPTMIDEGLPDCPYSPIFPGDDEPGLASGTSFQHNPVITH